MNSLIAFLQSEMGRRVVTWASLSFSAALQGGLIPLDAAVPILHISVAQLLAFLGVGVAATAGSSTRK